jgi:hypothetical protein
VLLLSLVLLRLVLLRLVLPAACSLLRLLRCLVRLQLAEQHGR